MKNSKIITTVVAMNLVVFLSVSSIANSFTGNTGDDANRSVKNQTESDKSSIVDLTSSNASENEFNHLRFNVKNFNIERELEELPFNSMDYLRFDVNNYNNATEISEMPVDEFDYLRFDLNKYSKETSSAIDELPVN